MDQTQENLNQKDSEMRLAADAEMQFCLRETNLGSGGIISNKEFLVHESWLNIKHHIKQKLKSKLSPFQPFMFDIICSDSKDKNDIIYFSLKLYNWHYFYSLRSTVHATY